MEIPEFFKMHMREMEGRVGRHSVALHKAKMAVEAEEACIATLNEEIDSLRGKLEEAARGGLFDKEHLDKEAAIRKINRC